MEPRQVLIVEDDPDNRELFADMLRLHGFAPRTARNGLEALALLRDGSRPPFAIVLDLDLPIVDGFSFLAQTGQDQQLGAVPVIVVSAVDRVRDIAPGGACRQTLAKPVDFRQLIAALERCAPTVA